MSAESAISVKNVSKNFKIVHGRGATTKESFVSLIKGDRKRKIENQQALKSVSFDIEKGEFFGIVGRNGSGKSTMLKMLAGIYQPTKGDISVNGKLVPFIELGVGFNPELTGRENVFLNGALLGFSEQEVADFYNEVVDFAELEKFMDKKLKNYSSGMQVRLAFAMAVRAKADILLVDEVLAVGDADFQRKCFNYFKLLKKNKKTVVFVSHDMNAIREFCDKAILIEKGKIIASGKPTKVANEYTKLFMNRAKSNSKNENPKRAGSGSCKIKDYSNLLIIKNKSSVINISFTIEVSEDVDAVSGGFRVKTADGKHLFGWNNHIAGLRIAGAKKGQTYRMDFEFDNILNSGEYSVDLAAESPEGEVFDWILDAIKIQVVTEKMTGYMIDPAIVVRINDEK